MTEILSPAGNYDSFKSAIASGADAIYMGVNKFSARAMANNFSIDEFIHCIKYAHLRGVKIYLTLNTLLTDIEVSEALEIIIMLYEHGLDAVIVQDIGIIPVIKKVIPDLDIHASTQMSIHSLEGLKYLEKLGVTRVVLARELTLKEIKHIRENTKLELEIFVHGALCMSYSGQCLMSSMIGDRSGNKGRCAATCRMKYTLKKDNEEITYGHLLSKKDIFGIDCVKELASIGIESLKIEGRGKTLEYVGLVTEKYRKALDEAVDAADEKELLQIFNREGKSFGYFRGVLKKESISINSAKNTGIYLGEVLDQDKKFIKVKLNEDINMQDGIELINTDTNEVVYSTIITCIRNERFKIINDLVTKDNVVYLGDINKNIDISSNIVVNKTSSKELNLKYANQIKTDSIKKVLVPIEIKIKENENIKVNILGEDIEFDYIPLKAENKPIDYVYLENSLCKTSSEIFEFEIVDFEIDDNLFMPISKINKLRNYLTDYLIEKNSVKRDVMSNYNLLEEYIESHVKDLSKNTLNSVKTSDSLFIHKYNKKLLQNYLSYNKDLIYITIMDIKRDENILNDLASKDVYITIPNIVHDTLNEYILNNLEIIVNSHNNIKGILLGNIGYIELCKKIKSKNDIKLVADYYLNISNTYDAMVYKNELFDRVCLSNEVSLEEVKLINKIIDIELVDKYITVMTTRFCPISSYTGKCDCNNLDSRYIIKDDLGATYFIVSDDIDCITKLVKHYDNEFTIKLKGKVSIRQVTI